MRYVCIFPIHSKFEDVLMMFKTKGPYLNAWNVPGGKIEEDEEPFWAAIREMKEETGITPDDMQSLSDSCTTMHRIVVMSNGDNFDELHMFFCLLKPDVNYQQLEEEQLSWMPITEVVDCTSFDDTLAGDGSLQFCLRLIYNKLKEYGFPVKLQHFFRDRDDN